MSSQKKLDNLININDSNCCLLKFPDMTVTSDGKPEVTVGFTNWLGVKFSDKIDDCIRKEAEVSVEWPTDVQVERAAKIKCKLQKYPKFSTWKAIILAKGCKCFSDYF